MNEEKNEIEKIREQERKDTEARAYELLVQEGDLFMKRSGPFNFSQEITNTRAFMTAWNRINHASLGFNLNTIEAMLAAVASLPVSMRRPEIANDPAYKDVYGMFSAMRNKIVRDRDERIRMAVPHLSTSETDQNPPAGVL